MLKKIIVIFLIVFLLIIGVLVAIPFMFKDKILILAKEEINNYVDAKVDFGDIGLSIFENFPNLTFSINDMSVVNLAPFEGDTLASIKSFSTTLDIMSVISGDAIQIIGIQIDKPTINVSVLEDGKASYDIAKETEESATVTSKPTEPSTAMRFSLQQYAINNANIIYVDKPAELYANIENLSHSGSGDFTLEIFDLQTVTTADKITVRSGGVTYLNKAALDLKIDLGVDLPNNQYVFKENLFKINNLALGFDGKVTLVDESTILDITYTAKETSFKSILSLVPAIYLTDFEAVKTEGKLTLTGFAKGEMVGERYPAFGLDLSVDNAMFQYPDLPTSVSNIYLDVKIENPDGDLDNTVVDISRFDLNLGKEPVAMKLNVKYPISDPLIDATMVGKVDLANVTQYYPLEEGDVLKGLLNADASFKGRLSSVENEQYEKLEAKGNMEITGLAYKGAELPEGMAAKKMRLTFSADKSEQSTTGGNDQNIKGNAQLLIEKLEYASEDLPAPLKMETLNLTLNPQKATLNEFKATIGKSDFSANGALQNVMDYALNDGTISGQINLNANYLDLNELMLESETASEGEVVEGQQPEPTVDDTVDELIPNNVDFVLNAKFKKVLYDNIELTDVTGKVGVKEEAVRLSDLKANVFKGTTIINGIYNTKGDGPDRIDFSYDIENIDIQELFKSVNTVEKLAPLSKNISGRLSSKMTMNGLLGDDFSPDLKTILANGKISLDNVKLTNLKVFDFLADKLKLTQFKELDIEKAWTVFEIVNGRIYIEPFDLNVNKINMNIGGSHGIDNTLDYNIQLKIPRGLLGKANDYMEGLLAKSPIPGLDASTLPESVKFNVGVSGTLTNPKYKLDFARKGLADAVKQRAKDELNKQKKDLEEKARAEIARLKAEARANAQAQADKLIQEARKQADKIKSEARKLADKAKKEGYAQAKKLEDDAKNPIAKVGAKVAADQLRKESDKRSKQLVTEADKKAKQLIDGAKNKSDKLIDDAMRKAEQEAQKLNQYNKDF